MSIRVALIEDNRTVRETLAMILEHSPGFACRHVFCDAETALAEFPADPPDVALVDIHLPGMSGIECVRRLKARAPRLQILMLTIESEAQCVFQSLAAGASGYLTKQSAPSELLAAVNRVLQGGRYITAALAEQLAQAFETGTEDVPHARLSDRELQVLRLLGQGKSVSVIAEELCLSVKTISTYRARILEKLSCESTGELIRYAIEAHLID